MPADTNNQSAVTDAAKQEMHMVYVEDQACNLPKVERAKLNQTATSTSNAKKIIHG